MTDTAISAPSIFATERSQSSSLVTPEWLAALGAAVAEHGPAMFEEFLADLAHQARTVSPAAAGVLTDREAPLNVRHRALAIVSAAVLRQG